MRLYVETNFPLEIAMDQEQAGPATELLVLAEARKLDLVYPVCAVIEPFSTLTYRDLERQAFRRTLQNQQTQIGRSIQDSAAADYLGQVDAMLEVIRDRHLQTLQRTIARMLHCGRCLTMAPATYQYAQNLQGVEELSPLDAIVYASVVLDLTPKHDHTSLFVSRDNHAFSDLKAALAALNCRFINSFDDALQAVLHA